MENENSVCYINKINKIEAIPDAEKLELAWVNGWASVVQKGIHKEGDLILCVTTDAVIPEDLATKWGVISYLRNKSRVRTVKLRGVYSECILIPLSDVPLKLSETISNLFEGRDLTDRLNIHKYEPPIREVVNTIKKVYFKWDEVLKFKMWKSFINYKIHKVRNSFKKYYKDNVNFNKYYKFPNQKNTPNMFNEEDIVVITRKQHGTNARYSIVKKNYLTPLDRLKKLFGNKWIGYEYSYGSHNCQKDSDSQGFYSTDVWKEIADKYDIRNRLWDFVKNVLPEDKLGKGIIVYGEIFGPGIQGELYDYGYTHLKLELFDIELNGEYLPDNEFQGYIEYLSIGDTVEYLYTGKWSKEIQDKLVLNQYFTNSKGKKVPEEGIVCKCITGDRKRISKVINPEYLTYSEKNNVEDSH